MWVILLIFLLPPLIDDPTIAQLKNNSDLGDGDPPPDAINGTRSSSCHTT